MDEKGVKNYEKILDGLLFTLKKYCVPIGSNVEFLIADPMVDNAKPFSMLIAMALCYYS